MLFNRENDHLVGGVYWEGLFLVGEGMGNFLASGERTVPTPPPHHPPSRVNPAAPPPPPTHPPKCEKILHPPFG